MKKRKTFTAVVVILVLSGIVSFASYFSGFKEDKMIRINNFPETIGPWKSKDIPLEKWVLRHLETNNLIFREYKNSSGQSIKLYIVYALSNRKAVLAPEICLQEEGGTVVDKTSVLLGDSFVPESLLLEKMFSRELVVYWFRIAGSNTSNLIKYQFKMALNQLRGRNTSIALIRVITDINDDDYAGALNRVKSFCSLLLPLLPKYVP